MGSGASADGASGPHIGALTQGFELCAGALKCSVSVDRYIQRFQNFSAKCVNWNFN